MPIDVGLSEAAGHCGWEWAYPMNLALTRLTAPIVDRDTRERLQKGGMPMNWTRAQVLAALHLYVQLPFGQLHSKNARIQQLAHWLGRTPGSVAMKLSNLASLDPQITGTGRVGLPGASKLDRDVWSVIVRRVPSLRGFPPAGTIRADEVRTRLMVCTNGDGAHHEGSPKRAQAGTTQP